MRLVQSTVIRYQRFPVLEISGVCLRDYPKGITKKWPPRMGHPWRPARDPLGTYADNPSRAGELFLQ